jgi:hypothetical protein
MPTVTLDTLVAEHPDVTALIDAARRDGYDIALVDVSQGLRELQPSSHRDGSVGEPRDADPALVLRARLLHLTGLEGSALITEPLGAGLVLTLALDMMADLHRIPLPPLRLSPSSIPAEQRQWREIRRPIVYFLRALRIIGYGAAGPFGASASSPLDQTRLLRVAAGVMAHAQGRRDIFVSDPAQVGLHDGRRRALTRVLNTRLMTVEEFRSSLTRNGGRGKNHGDAGG